MAAFIKYIHTVSYIGLDAGQVLVAPHPIQNFLLLQYFKIFSRVARFLGYNILKQEKIIPKCSKCTKWPYNIIIVRKIDHIDIKCTNIFHRKTLQNLPKLVFLV
jgi:hypothetical protein